VNGKPLSKAADDLLRKVVQGFQESTEHSIVDPWDLSYAFIADIRRIEMSSLFLNRKTLKRESSPPVHRLKNRRGLR